MNKSMQTAADYVCSDMLFTGRQNGRSSQAVDCKSGGKNARGLIMKMPGAEDGEMLQGKI